MRNPLLAAGLAATFALAPAGARAEAFDTPTSSGAIGPGTVYGIWVPSNWNGDLVLYAHGFRNPNCPLAVPTTPESYCAPLPGMPATDSGTPQAVRPMRDALLGLGYAFAASSYSDTALALKEGAQQTFQLKGIFASRFGQPRRTWLYGHSMGGAIVVKLAEQHPGAFDGALAACGMIDGSPTQIQYVIDGRATFDAIFPGVVPGGVARVPDGLTFYGDVAPRVLALFDARNPQAPANFAKAMAWAKLDQVGFPFTSPAELVKGILEFLYFQTLGTPKLLADAHGVPGDNTGVLYTGSPIVGMLGVDLAQVNATAERVASDPQGVQFGAHYYEASGALGIPVLTLHTVRDAAVPMVHERRFAERTAAAGRSGLLVQRTVAHATPDGHCTFKVEEELAAFSDLVSWVETGAPPSGGDATVP